MASFSLTRREWFAASGTLISMAHASGTRAQIPGPQGRNFEDLLTRASKEEEVVFYTEARNEEARVLSRLWKAKYPGITLTIVGKKSPELATQLETERAAGLFAVDLININQPGLAQFWKNKGYYEPYKVAAFDLLRPDYADEAGAFYTSGIYLLPCAYNTRAFPNGQGLPDSLQDFLDPKWRGKLVLAHPRTAGNVRTFFLGHLGSGKIDWTWIAGLARQDVLFVRGHVDAIRIIASGERIITPTTSTFNVLAARGNHQAIDIHTLKEGTILAEQHIGILERAPHPNSAKLLLELLTSREGQETIAAGGQYWPVTTDARLGADLPKLADLNPIRVDAPADTESVEREFVQRFDQVFGRS